MLSRAKVCQSYPFFVPLFSGLRVTILRRSSYPRSCIDRRSESAQRRSKSFHAAVATLHLVVGPRYSGSCISRLLRLLWLVESCDAASQLVFLVALVHQAQSTSGTGRESRPRREDARTEGGQAQG
jgi:hypothetical protein